jgi:hypothetical protein
MQMTKSPIISGYVTSASAIFFKQEVKTVIPDKYQTLNHKHRNHYKTATSNIRIKHIFDLIKLA